MLSKFALYGFLVQLLAFNTLLATNTNAQRIVSVKDIFLDMGSKEMSIVQTFRYIESNTNLKINYEEKDIDGNLRIITNQGRTSVEKILLDISKISNLRFRQVNQSINVLKNARKTSKPPVEVIIEGVTITGRVTSSEDNEGLPGANVIVKGTTQGTVTDVNGNYSIEVPSAESVLVFSSVGYQKEEVAVGVKTVIDMVLSPDIKALQEIVVVGYGTQKKSDLTGSVASVNDEDLTAYPSTNAVQALQGRAAGVTVQSVNGEPGGDYKIRVRGATSINASSDPLIVVDGLVGGMMPPPEDIASIEVLKDASASAIYGSRAANGVVMVTTKSGKLGKARVDINSYYSFQHEIGRLDLLNAHDFAEYINEARNSNFYDVNAQNIDTDWQLIFRPGHTQNHQVSVSGGSDKIKYYVSGVYFDQGGVIKNSDYDRFSLTSNLKFDLNDHIRINLNSILQSSKNEGVLTQTGGGVTNAGVVTAAQRFDPNLGILDENGDYTKSKVGIAAFENPMAVIDGREEEIRQDNIQTNLKAEFDITKGLVFNSTFGVIIRNQRDGVYNNRISNLGEGTNGLGNLSYGRNFNFLTEQYLNYKFSLNEKNNFDATAGYSYQDFKNESFSASNAGFLTDALGYWNLGVGTNLQAPSSSYTESKIASFYGRLNYNYDNRYFLTVTGRYDGASQFSEGNQWSFFPSGAFSWNISNEGFYPQNDVLSVLKFRTSYGLTGNQAINPYQSLARISSTFFVLNNASVSSVRPTAIANKDLTWETTAQFDVGLDLEFFDGRINMTGDYYYKKTNDLLFSVPIPSFSGYQNRLENLGEIENKGFELQINSKNLISKLAWSTGLNLTLNQNKVLSLPNNVDIIYASAPSFTGAVENSILRVGEPVGSFYGYVYEGVYQEGDDFIPGGAFETTPGGEKFADLDNNGVLDSNDRKIIGNPNPKAVWGLNNDFSYKGFNLNIFFQASTGGDMLNLVKMELDRLSGNSNATTDALKRWTPENTNTDVPKAASGRVPRTSTRFVEDGSYIRLKNVSLGYDFPSDLISKLKVSSARIYVSGQNLLTFTNYSGVDPEVAFRSSNTNLGLDYGSYPNTIAYTVGINLGF